MSNDFTPEGAALRLLEYIAWAENKEIDTSKTPTRAPSRGWILATYGQCLSVVKDYPNAEDYLKNAIPQ